jgi:hypothetical protein
MRNPIRTALLVMSSVLFLPASMPAQLQILETKDLRLVYYDKAHAYLVPYLARCFENSLGFEKSLFHYTPSEKIVILLQDFGDYGSGGTSTVPWNYISIGLEPFDYVYETMPANERMNWLMHHELVHVVATDKAAGADKFFRSLFRGKVAPTAEDPPSMFYSFLSSPRWYSPRWYHEGIAVFLETWMAGGLGRVLGGYDEMVFRTMVLEGSYFYDMVGLESEGTTIDFQVGQNSYLYGTRFVSYLASLYGPEKVLRWFNRDEGSRSYFSSQFGKVYGISLDEAWANWIRSEHDWQKANLDLIGKNPVTPVRDVAVQPLGSVSRAYFSQENQEIYAGINYPGEGAQIAAIDIRSGKRRKICEVATPTLYYVTSLAYDPASGKLFFTTDNSQGWRDLNEVDVHSGQRKRLLKDCRTGDLVVNPADKAIWGVQHHNGLSALVRIPPPYSKGWNTILTLDYGKDIFDLDISPDGKRLSASMIEVNGRQRLIAMDLAKLQAGDSAYEVLHEFENNSPENFVFSPDGRYLYGTSYYSGVSNIFRYDLQKRNMDAMSNVETGLFRPLQIAPDSLLAFRYTSKGFVPVVVPLGVVEDVNAIQYLGQQVVEKYPIVTTWTVGSPAQIDLDARKVYEGAYNPIRQVRPASLYPVAEGYKDTYAVGVHLNFADPVGLNMINVAASYSPQGELQSNEKIHLSLSFDHWPWKFKVKHNGTDFYDLFGPTKTSRKGTMIGVGYQGYLINERPKTLQYKFDATGFLGLDRLPDYQNVVATYDKLLSVGASLNYGDVRRSLGAVDGEKGVSWSLGFRNEIANAKAYPRLSADLDYGFRLPIMHSSLWLRGSAGQSFGDRTQPFGKFYFGGFGNNYVDHQENRRYRESYSFPGMKLNEIGGARYGKLLAEWTLPPLRFRRLGFPIAYANWVQPVLFTGGLIADSDTASPARKLGNIGGQADLKLVLFSNLESTLSVGYAAAFGVNRTPSREFMISLKILR